MLEMQGLQIQTKSVCTAKCVFCPHPDSWHNTNPGEMTDEVFDQILSEVERIRFDKICPYLMNEPLADRKIFDRIEEIKRRCRFGHIEVSTNATLLDGRRSEELIRVLEDTANDIWISFHGTDSDTYRGVMGVKYERTLRNVRDFLVRADGKLKVQIKGAGGPHIETEDCPSWFAEEDFHNFWSGVFDELRLRNRPDLFYFKYNDRAGNIGSLSYDFRRDSLAGFRCHRTDQWLHFLYTGEVALCCNDYFKEHMLGDVRASTLDEVLRGSQRRSVVDMVEGRTESPDDFICKRCDMHLN